MTKKKENIEEVVEIDPFEKMVNHDFSSEENFDIEENYQYLEELEKEHNDMKSQEAEYLIRDEAPKYLKEEDIVELEKIRQNLYSLMRKYDVNSDIIKDVKTNRTKLFAIASFMFKSFQNSLNELIFKFELTNKECVFLFRVLKHKLEYDSNEILNMVEVKDTFLDKYGDMEKLKGDGDVELTISIKSLVLLHHLISKYSVKGVNEEFYLFRDILIKIANMIKVFNSYGVLSKRLYDNFDLWNSVLSDEVEPNKQQMILQEEQSA